MKNVKLGYYCSYIYVGEELSKAGRRRKMKPIENERKELVKVAIKAIDNCIKTGMVLHVELENHGQRIYFLDLDDDSLSQEAIPILGKYEFEILGGNEVESCYSLEPERILSPMHNQCGEYE